MYHVQLKNRMMKFFREIRQKLTAENNVAKYMRYAIEEIFMEKEYRYPGLLFIVFPAGKHHFVFPVC